MRNLALLPIRAPTDTRRRSARFRGATMAWITDSSTSPPEPGGKSFAVGGGIPHVLRHFEACNDRALKLRTLDEVQKRGRWLCASCVLRYENRRVLVATFPRVTLTNMTQVVSKIPQRLFAASQNSHCRLSCGIKAANVAISRP